MAKIKKTSWSVRLGFASLIFGSVVFFTSCGGLSTPRNYSGAGSLWNVLLNPATATFTITHQTAASGGTTDMTVSGTFVTYATGFLKLTVTASTGTSAPAVGSTAYGLEIPGSVFFLKPMGATDNIIPMIPSTTCPTANLSLNWIDVKVPNAWTDSGSSLNGTFTYTQATGASVVNTTYSLAAPTTNMGSNTVGTGTCSGGVISIANNADLFLTPSGGAIVHTAPNTSGSDSIIIAMPQASAAVSPSSLSGSYAGLVFQSGQNSGGSAQNFPVSLTLTTSGTTTSGPGYQLTDVATGTRSAQGVKITLTNSGPASGMTYGSIDFTGPTGGGSGAPFVRNISCISQQSVSGTSKNVLVCGAEDAAGTPNFFSIILVSI